MEFRFLAQQQLELFGNIFLGIFTVAVLFFCVMLYLNGREKESIFASVALYTSLVVSLISFSFALLLSNYNPYDQTFTEQIMQTVQAYSYAVLGILFAVSFSTFVIVKLYVKKKR